MLCRLIIIVLLVLADIRVDAANLKGVIIADEMGGSPIANVQVADQAQTTNPVVSDDLGRFTLEFRQRRAGETVCIIVKKEGYLVVNDVQLQLALPADADATVLTIILCKQGDREEMARRFYRLKSFEAIEEAYKKRLKELEDLQQATAVALAKLQKERHQARAATEMAAQELAKNEPGRNSELYQQAKRRFVEGKVEEAITLLDEEKLRQLDLEANKAVENAIQPRLLKAQLHTVLLRFEDAEKA